VAEQPDKEQQTEAPTPKRKADAAKDGDVLISKELATALSMGVGALWLVFAGAAFVDACKQLLRQGLSLDLSDPAQFDAQTFNPTAALIDPLLGLAPTLLGLMLLSVVAALASPAMLGSFGVRSKAMAFKGSRINPLSGIKRIFGVQGLTELAKSIIKVALLGYVGYAIIAGEIADLPVLARTDPAAASAVVGDMLARTVALLTLCLILIAIIDVPTQWFSRNRRLRMSKQQVKEELRQSDGAPELKQALRARQQQILMSSARKGMADASVVLTNPTHFAVALRYRPGLDAAPVVVARGRGEVALAIKAMAKERAVPTLEYPQLTRAIYFTTRTGRTVSEDLYVAVAAILAFVFRLDSGLAGEMRAPVVEVPAAKRFDTDGKRV
jgi:flagellar biosynthesis protein FlhB